MLLESISGVPHCTKIFRFTSYQGDGEFLRRSGWDEKSRDEMMELLRSCDSSDSVEELCDEPFKPGRRIGGRRFRRTRFSDGSFPVFYCAVDAETAKAEALHWFCELAGGPHGRRAWYRCFTALLKQVWVELEPIRRVHEGRRRRRGSSELTRGFRFRGGRAVACCGCRGRVAEGRPACQRATRVLRWAPVLRMTRRPSLRSESSYGPCGPAWTGASRPSTTSRRAREE